MRTGRKTIKMVKKKYFFDKVVKPEFDHRVEPYLDQNMKQNLEKIRKIVKATETRELRHKKIEELRQHRSSTKEKILE